MDAEIIDIRTGRLLASPAAPTMVAPAITATEALAECRELVASAYALVRSARACEALIQADALLEGLSDAFAEVTPPASVGGMW